MRSLSLLLTSIFSLFILSGCTIKQEIKNFNEVESKEVCILKNDTVREFFLESYVQALENKLYKVKVVETVEEMDFCSLKSTYSGNWRYELGVYLVYAKINVFKDNVQIGEAVYDSSGGIGNYKKFISADKKINELVDKLYP